MIQPDLEGDTGSRVAGARCELGELTAVGSAAEVPVDIETRVNHNVAFGIAQGAIKIQVNAVSIVWDATQSYSRGIFGSIIDQVLDQTRLPVLISRLDHPVTTTKLVFVLVVLVLATLVFGRFLLLFFVTELLGVLGDVFEGIW
ncbi:hypothetical protein [Halegenticoccus tardaugens]|uniref:hypothetical protein n=1 Tax=Halegenticoccus tardaugens TaxID=2071624 RepID=UPI0011B4CD14|nr:hypothetical protein [Halegenticoccus tardaugens]